MSTRSPDELIAALLGPAEAELAARSASSSSTATSTSALAGGDPDAAVPGMRART